METPPNNNAAIDTLHHELTKNWRTHVTLFLTLHFMQTNIHRNIYEVADPKLNSDNIITFIRSR